MSKQRTITRSTTEAKYRAMLNTSLEVTWLINLLQEFHVTTSIKPVLLYDNVRATYLSANPVFHSRTIFEFFDISLTTMYKLKQKVVSLRFADNSLYLIMFNLHSQKEKWKKKGKT